MTEIKSAIEDFILYCKHEKKLSTKTQKFYTIDLTQFLQFLTKENYQLEIKQIDKTVIRLYLYNMSEFKPTTIKRKIATLKAFFNFLEFEDKILFNPFRKMRIKIKDEKKLPSVMNLREITIILKKAYEYNKQLGQVEGFAYCESIRNIVVIELLFSTGARVSEIANLRIENIQLDTGSFLIKGKGNKERIIQVCNKESLSLLKKYYTLFKDNINKAGGYFLINRFNKKLSDQSIRGIVKKLAIKAGILRQITPHVFRHSFATLLLEKDVDIRYIQILLGHSSILTTQLYTHVSRKKQRQILTTKHPRKDIIVVPIE